MNRISALAIAIMMGLSLASCRGTNSSTTRSDKNSNMHEKKSSAPDKQTKSKSKEEKKILVAYFSHTGNTRVIANQIHQSVGGDIYEIVTVDPYPDDYDTLVKKAKQEQQDNYRPKLAAKVENMDSYNVIFVGYPNWCDTMPMAVFTFLEEYNFSGKTIAPFCTHGGSALGRSVMDIKKLCPKSTILDGLAIKGSTVKTAQGDVSKWLHKIGMIKN